jgi:hypothetical protein
MSGSDTNWHARTSFCLAVANVWRVPVSPKELLPRTSGMLTVEIQAVSNQPGMPGRFLSTVWEGIDDRGNRLAFASDRLRLPQMAGSSPKRDRQALGESHFGQNDERYRG